MSLVNYSLVQGIVAGGTASYLQDRVKKESIQKKPDTWVTVALQANHLLLLTAETVRFAGVALGGFGLLVQTAYVLTPLSLAAVGLSKKEVVPLSPQRAEYLNTAYRMGVIANSVATLALGNPVFAAASLSMLAIDAVVKGEAGQVFAQIKKVAALCALIGYGAQVFVSQGVMASLAQVSTVIMGAKLCVFDLIRGRVPTIATDQKESTNLSTTFPKKRPEFTYYDDRDVRSLEDQEIFRKPVSISPQPMASSSKFTQSGNVFCRPGAWG